MEKRKLSGWKRWLAVLLTIIVFIEGSWACIWASAQMPTASNSGAVQIESEIGTLERITNIVIVVDCSTSMQVSDAQWNIPEALQMMVDMCPDDKNIRFSLITYGGGSNTLFYDTPLTTEGRDEIHRGINQIQYSMGKTDTGLALWKDALPILKDHEGANNMVLLITDGVINASGAGRSDEISQAEINSFAAYCMDHGATVNTLGIFNENGANKAEAEKAQEELSELRIRTGGCYKSISDTSEVSTFFMELLSQTLDVNLKNTAEGIAEQNGYSYDFELGDSLITDTVIILPNPGADISGAWLENRDTGETYVVTQKGTEASEYVGSGWYSGRRKIAVNGTMQGYWILQVENQYLTQPWTGNWTLHVETNAQTAPQMVAFDLYDLDIHLTFSSENVPVMEEISVKAYLTQGSEQVRVDDIDFYDSLTATITVINESNGSLFDTAEMRRVNDSFIYPFEAEYTSDYRFKVTLEKENFSRSIESVPIQVTDQLEILFNVAPQSVHKGESLAVNAYLVQNDNHKMVENASFYANCGARVIMECVTDEGETIHLEQEMEGLENGTGLVAKCPIRYAGTYSIYVMTESERETVVRTSSEEQEKKLVVVDRPVQAMSGTLPGHLVIGEAYEMPLDNIFQDADGEEYQVDWEILNGDAEVAVIADENGEKMLQILPKEEGALELHLNATDYRGNVAERSLKTSCITKMLEVFYLVVTIVAGIVVALILILIGLVLHCKKNFLGGFVRVELWFNRSELRYKHDSSIEDPVEYAKQFPELRVGAFWIPIEKPKKELDNGQDVHVFNDKKERLTLKEILHGRRYEVWHLLERFRDNYRLAGFDNDGVWKLMYQRGEYDFLGSDDVKKMGALTGISGGRDFKIVDVDKKGVMVEKLDGEKKEITLMLSKEWRDKVMGAISNMKDKERSIEGFQAESVRVILSYQPFKKSEK